MTRVHCTVSNCEYWGQGNVCQAEEILVTGEPIKPEDTTVDEHGRGAERYPATPVRLENGAYCFTFEPVQARRAEEAA